MRMAKDCVISAKVTSEIAKAIKAQAKSEGKSVSAWVSDRATNTKGMALGGAIVPEAQLSTILEAAVVFGGSSFVGILTYKGIFALLQDANAKKEIKYTESEIEVIATLLGVTSAILTGKVLQKLIRRK
jgi:hypothetical protein